MFMYPKGRNTESSTTSQMSLMTEKETLPGTQERGKKKKPLMLKDW